MLNKEEAIRWEWRQLEHQRIRVYAFLCKGACGTEVVIASGQLKTKTGFCHACACSLRKRKCEPGNFWCPSCSNELTEDCFQLNKKTGKRAGYCKKCYYEKGKTSVAKRILDPEEKENIIRTKEKARFKWQYGIAIEQYEQMFADQKGVCKVCGNPETKIMNGRVAKLSVDHDHSCCPHHRSCGECVKSLLCGNCNAALGFAKDNPKILESLLKYAIETRTNELQSKQN